MIIGLSLMSIAFVVYGAVLIWLLLRVRSLEDAEQARRRKEASK